MQHKRFRQPLMVQHNAQMRIIIVGGKLYSLEKKTPATTLQNRKVHASP